MRTSRRTKRRFGKRVRSHPKAAIPEMDFGHCLTMGVSDGTGWVSVRRCF